MSVQARYSFDAETDFKSLKTYTWMPGLQERFSDPVNADHYKNAMNAQLASKGFKLTPENPDFLIRTYPSKQYREVYLMNNREIEFHKGILVMDFVDAKSSVVIWEGVAYAFLSEETNPEELKKSIYLGVEKLMRGFPPTDVYKNPTDIEIN
jgi:hypothetical protein